MEEEHGKTKRISLAIIIILLFATGISTAKFIGVKNQLVVSEKVVAEHHYNDGALSFMKLFIEKVLEAKTDISLDDRVDLENKVRELKDPEISATWKAFGTAKTESDAQEAVKKLLKLLTDKIKV